VAQDITSSDKQDSSLRGSGALQAGKIHHNLT